MAKRPPKKEPPSFSEKLMMIKAAGIGANRYINSAATPPADDETLPMLNERIRTLLDVVKQSNATTMLYFIMYDIEDNKIRVQISKYLERKGCIRVQKSIFFASSNRKIFDEIAQTLKEVNEVYDNRDSILLVPISSDLVKSMRLVGKNVDFEMITGNKNTLFF